MQQAAMLTLLLLLAAPSPAAAPLPLFDGHIHFNADASRMYTPAEALAAMRHAGIRGALVSSTPNEGTHALQNLDPGRIVPEIRPYRAEADRGNWYNDPGIADFVDQELRRGGYRAVGEFHLFGSQAASPVVGRIVRTAVERDLPLHAHADAQAVDILFDHGPRARILWAHAGMNASVAEIGRMLDRHPNLMAELSYRDDVAPAGKLDVTWRELFLRHPQRFVFGSDTWTASRWRELGPLAQAAREWLAQLPPDVAENIAWRNAERLFAPRQSGATRAASLRSDTLLDSGRDATLDVARHLAGFLVTVAGQQPGRPCRHDDHVVWIRLHIEHDHFEGAQDRPVHTHIEYLLVERERAEMHRGNILKADRVPLVLAENLPVVLQTARQVFLAQNLELLLLEAGLHALQHLGIVALDIVLPQCGVVRGVAGCETENPDERRCRKREKLSHGDLPDSARASGRARRGTILLSAAAGGFNLGQINRALGRRGQVLFGRFRPRPKAGAKRWDAPASCASADPSFLTGINVSRRYSCGQSPKPLQHEETGE
jgi:hypothetical protein